MMSALLDLHITAEEYKSSQPPKPAPNAWEEFLPDSKTKDGQSIRLLSRPDSVEGEASVNPPLDKEIQEQLIPRGPAEPIPREVGPLELLIERDTTTPHLCDFSWRRNVALVT